MGQSFTVRSLDPVSHALVVPPASQSGTPVTTMPIGRLYATVRFSTDRGCSDGSHGNRGTPPQEYRDPWTAPLSNRDLVARDRTLIDSNMRMRHRRFSVDSGVVMTHGRQSGASRFSAEFARRDR